MKKALWMYMVLGVALLVLAPSAKADTLAPGSTINFSSSTWAFATPGLANIVEDTGPTAWSYTTTENSTSVTTSGLYQEIVIADPNNVYGVGDLTWILAVGVDAGDSLDRLTVSSFSGFNTTVGYDAPLGFNSGSGSYTPVDPATADRSSDGSIVGFNWPVGVSTAINPGDYSLVLEIQTNATSVQPGQVAIIDSATKDEPGWAPAVPEPATLSLMGMGLLGLLGLRKKRIA